MEVLLNQIIVDADRQRKDLGDLEGLKKSLLNLGLLNPLVVEPAGELGLESGTSSGMPCYKLIAGERRYTALKELVESGELEEDFPIRITLFQDLDTKARYLLELDENIKRKDLDWKEYCQALDKMYTISQPCTIEQFSQDIGINRSSVGKALAVASMLGDPLVQQAKNLSNAWTIVSRINSRKLDSMILDIDELLEEEEMSDESVEGDLETCQGNLAGLQKGFSNQSESGSLGLASRSPDVGSVASTPVVGLAVGSGNVGSSAAGSTEHLADGVGQGAQAKPSIPSKPALAQYSIQQGDFFQFAASYKGLPFNLIHCDFPYGIDHSRSEQGSTGTYGAYEDTEDLYKSLVRCLLEHKDQLIAPSAHVVCWLSLRFLEWTKEEFAKHGFTWNLQPFIWYKKDNRGIIADKDCGFRNVGEYALIFNRGRRKVCKNISNIFPHQTTKKFHASEKPVDMLEYLFSGLADETSRVLDPTCGSGTAIHAAIRAHAESALGLELDPSFAQKAQEWLEIEKASQSSLPKGLDIKIDLEELDI